MLQLYGYRPGDIQAYFLKRQRSAIRPPQTAKVKQLSFFLFYIYKGGDTN